MHTTSPTLLDCLQRSGSAGASERFVGLYSAGMYSWARGMGLQHADAADLVQEVFAIVYQRIPEFEHTRGGSFRGWLWTITRNKCLQQARGRHPSIVPSASLDKFADELDNTMCEEDFRRHVIGRVVPMLKADFPASVWGPFWAHVVEGKPASQVAAEHGINIWAVYTAKIRVIAHLNKELGDLVTN